MPLNATQIGELAPYLRLHSKEEYFPMDPVEFISHSRFRHHKTLFWDNGYNKVEKKWIRTNSQDDKYYDIPINYINSIGPHLNGKNRRPQDANCGWRWNIFLEHKQDDPMGDPAPNDRVPAFHYVTTIDQYTLIQYWWFLGYSVFGKIIFPHQGDWEHVMAVVDQDHQIVGAYMSHHHEKTFYGRKDLEWKENRFVVYCAKRSHASYPRPGNYQIFGVDQTDKDGYEWQTWNSLHPLADQPWKDFAGAWGNFGGGTFTTGPLGPWYKLPSSDIYDFEKIINK